MYLKSKKRLVLLQVFFATSIYFTTLAQKPAFTADERVDQFGVPFGYGFNPGYYGDNQGNVNLPGFNREGVSYDIALAQLGANLGLNTSRPSLPCYFFLQYGNSQTLSLNNFQLRKNEFAAYPPLGIKNQVVFIGDATDHHDGQYVDPTTLVGKQYRNLVKYPNCNAYSYEFKNLYAPVWDNGANGTAINDTNYYALYIYKLVTNYKDYIKVYEIVNEIDFPGNGFDAGKGPGTNGWYDRAPDPCELLNWRAPIYSYIRTMRIAYEVIKSIDPTAFIAIGGIGNESFLDASLRYSDNPADGSINNDYPKKGGAYFDLLSYHYYPHYDLRKKAANGIDNVFPFVYQRYSDEAMNRTVFKKKASIQAILTKYGYDGTAGKFPLKHFIITEANIPRRTYPGQDWIGSDAAQRNFLMKTFIKAPTNKIDQVHVFSLGEQKDITDVSSYEGHEGFYENLSKAKRTSAKKLQSGIGTQTLTYLAGKSKYDSVQTQLLAIPSNMDGVAYKSEQGKFTYAIWAKTTVDNSEVASATFTFPSALGITGVTKAEWDFSFTGKVTTILSNIVTVSGSPTFFTDIKEPILASTDEESTFFSSLAVYPIPAKDKINISFQLGSSETVSCEVLGMDGKLRKSLLTNTPLSTGDHYYEFEDFGLGAGIYVLRIHYLLSGKTSYSKIIIED